MQVVRGLLCLPLRLDVVTLSLERERYADKKKPLLLPPFHWLFCSIDGGVTVRDDDDNIIIGLSLSLCFYPP